MEAYCFKCRSKREINNPEEVTLKMDALPLTALAPSVAPKYFA